MSTSLIKIVSTIILGGIGTYFFASALSSGNRIMAVFYIIIASLFFLTVAVILSPSLSEILATPFSWVYYGNKKFDKDEAQYSMAESRQKAGRYTEALEAYLEILENFPNEDKAYSSLMEISLMKMNDRDGFENFYNKAKAQFSGNNAMIKNIETKYQYFVDLKHKREYDRMDDTLET